MKMSALGTILQDLRHAFRRWTRRPGFALAAVLTLALGIGATTAIFSVIDAVVLCPLPYPDPDRLVVVYSVRPERRHQPATAATWNSGRISRPMLDALQSVPGFERAAAWTSSAMTLGDRRLEIVSTLHVSSTYLPTLGARIIHGRHFNAREDEVLSDSIIITHDAWIRRFGGRPEAVGERIALGYASSGDQSTYTIVGIVQPAVTYPGAEPEFLLPIGYFAEAARTYPSLSLWGIGRLAAGVDRQAALAQADAAVGTLSHSEPTSLRLVPLAEEQLGNAARPLWLLFGGAALLLLIACSNVAGLLLGEGRVRRQEIAIRTAIGGSRARIARQLAVEHLVLACAGAVAGILLAIWLTQSVVAIAPAGLPRVDAVVVDLRVASFGLAMGFATLLLFGLLPAVTLARTPAAEALSTAARTAALRRHFGQRMAVAAQLSLALVLLVSASLFGETILRLTSQPLGFNPAHLAVIATSFTGFRWGDPAGVKEALRRGRTSEVMNRSRAATSSARTVAVSQRLSALPGVLRVAGASAVPFSSVRREIPISLEGHPERDVHRVATQGVTEGYFETMEIPIVGGRSFDRSDQYGAHAAIVSRAFADRFFGGAVLGRRFAYRWGSEPTHVSNFEVTGIVANVKHRGLSDEDAVVFYTLDRQGGGDATHLLVRTSGDAAAALPAIRQAIADVDPQLVVTETTTIETRLAASIAEERFRATLSILFGSAALVLAAVGLYGLAARRAAERRHEIGVRVALGASPGNIRSLILRDGLIIVGLGLLAGMPGAYASSQVTRSFLFGVSPSAPHVFVLAVTLLACTALLAMLVPAVRASRADPTLTLRE